MIRRKEEVCVYENRFFTVFDDKVTFNDTVDGRYFRIKPNKTRGSVIVFALTDEMELLLTEEYRYAQQGWSITTAAGQVESSQSVYDAALMELQQEIGVACDNLIHLGSVHELPSILDNETFILVATNIKPLATGQSTEAEESIKEHLIRLSLRDVEIKIRNNEITHSGFIAGFFKLIQFLENNGT